MAINEQNVLVKGLNPFLIRSQLRTANTAIVARIPDGSQSLLNQVSA